MPCLLSSEIAQKGKYNTNTDADKQKRIQKLFVSKQTWFAKKDKNRNRVPEYYLNEHKRIQTKRE